MNPETREFAAAVLELGNDIMLAATAGDLQQVKVLTANLCLMAAIVDDPTLLEEEEADPYDLAALRAALGNDDGELREE